MHRNPSRIMKNRKPLRAATPSEIQQLAARREVVCRDMMREYAETQCHSPTTPAEMDMTKFNLLNFETDALKLYCEFQNCGYFAPTMYWLAHKTALLLFFLGLSIAFMKTEQIYGEAITTGCAIMAPLFQYILPGTALGLFWNQAGYLMHDAEHHNVAGNERLNDILGWLYGTVFLGVNGAWWREEHKEHHALLNTFDETGFLDPQVCYSIVGSDKY